MKSFLLGSVQGLTEFLPISSSGHLVLIQFLFHESPHLFFILLMHLGTLVAIVAFYRKKLINTASIRSWRLLGLVGTALLPCVVGFLIFKSWIESAFQNPLSVGICFVVTGCGLFASRWLPVLSPSSRPPAWDWEFMSFKTAFLIGCAQTFALLPGISRSGWTIVTALFLRVPKKEAVFFSFLIAIPTILGGILLLLMSSSYVSMSSNQDSMALASSLALAFLSACFVGYLALQFVICIVQNRLLHWWAFYLWPLGVLTILIDYI